MQLQPDEPSRGLEPTVPEQARPLQSHAEGHIRHLELPLFQERLAGQHEQPGSSRVQLRQQISGTMEEVCGRRHVSAGERPVPRRGQQTRAMDPDLSPVVVHRPQLCQDQEGLLQVIAEDLLVFAHALRGGTLRPGHELLMELSPAPLEKALVGGILDQPMEERIALLAGEPVLV